MAFTLRPATEADAKRLFDWRNDPVTRANSISTEPVLWDNHISWFTTSLKQDRRRILIAEADGAPVGTLRIDATADGLELSWTVAPEARKHGYGTKMVMLGMDIAGPHSTAKIKPDNAASLRIADHCGFLFDRMEDGLMVMKR